MARLKRYLLDTNTVSHLLRAEPSVLRRVVAVPMASLCISAITEGELHSGLAKRPGAKRLHSAVHEFMSCVEVLPWDSAVAKKYGALRADLELRGKTLAPLDLLIGAHALGVDAILVTNDRAFGNVASLKIEDWTK